MRRTRFIPPSMPSAATGDALRRQRAAEELESIGHSGLARTRFPLTAPGGRTYLVGMIVMLAAAWGCAWWFALSGERMVPTALQHWLLVGSWLTFPPVFAAVFLLIYRGHVRAARALEARCPRCGYDMRAAPDRCPGCGAELVDGVTPGVQNEREGGAS